MLHLQGLIKKHTLTGDELAEIHRLTDICEQHDQLHMRIAWGMLETRSGSAPEDFLYYEQGKLVGYLAVDSWGEQKKEMTGMVHPAYRRQGIFRTLLLAAQQTCIEGGAEQVLLVCERSSSSGQAFARAIEARYESSEHEMVLTHFQPRQSFDDRLCFRQAEFSDLDALVAIQTASFGGDQESARARTAQLLHDPTRRYYIMTFGEEPLGCEEPVGSLRLDEWDHVVGIYAVGIIPEYQGRGYGRQMLEEVILAIGPTDDKTIMLDVDTTNVKAVNLYRSCGFEIKTTYDYYDVTHCTPGS